MLSAPLGSWGKVMFSCIRPLRNSIHGRRRPRRLAVDGVARAGPGDGDQRDE